MIMDQASTKSRFWLDDDDAMERIALAPVSEEIKAIARALHTDGIAVIRGANSKEVCRSVVADYKRYSEENEDYVRSNLTEEGREKRLVNFHLRSDGAAKIGCNPGILSALDFIFGRETAVYTSLTFKYGTQQCVHRDTPHFATWPSRMFVGMWTALEDVSPDAGPLFYHPGAHRMPVDPRVFMDEANSLLPGAPLNERLLMALDLYNGNIIQRTPQVAPAKLLEMEAGDTVVWHPEMPHGGSSATDPGHTRWSIVFHCAPIDVQVHQHDKFFTHQGPAAPPDRYGYFERFGRSFAVSGEVGYM